MPDAAAERRPRLAVLTGAGISAPSGLPVYRGGDGMWDRGPGIAKLTSASRWHGKARQAWEHWNELRRMRASIGAARHADVWIAIGTSGTVFPAAGLIGFCRPGAVRVLVNAQPWRDSASTFEKEVLGDDAAVLGEALRELTARPAGH
ncbi:hypothetical protein [Bailinhaonella thermotolerans]|uniref:Uncharacterized protein n=1 Tax=Bailinhaonella thermotolerans TaxID=1070861 RepID=A0A3A4B4V8_9ACTN|nr:hypothetical protein [Bailinhaonella thermotolerans]RJL35620.1 hypothetical protein D5H75_02190 [Bailinhaonella thermotolerans]